MDYSTIKISKINRHKHYLILRKNVMGKMSEKWERVDQQILQSHRYKKKFTVYF